MNWLQENILALKTIRMETTISTQIQSHTRPVGTPASFPQECLHLPDTSIPVSDSNYWPTDLLLQPHKFDYPLETIHSHGQTTNSKSQAKTIQAVTEEDIGVALVKAFRNLGRINMDGTEVYVKHQIKNNYTLLSIWLFIPNFVLINTME